MQVADPKYIAEMAEDQQEQPRCRFLIRLAALYYSPEGRVNTLSSALGMHSNSLAGCDTITAELAIRLEKLLGREHFPREMFRPDLFVIQE